MEFNEKINLTKITLLGKNHRFRKGKNMSPEEQEMNSRAEHEFKTIVKGMINDETDNIVDSLKILKKDILVEIDIFMKRLSGYK